MNEEEALSYSEPLKLFLSHYLAGEAAPSCVSKKWLADRDDHPPKCQRRVLKEDYFFPRFMASSYLFSFSLISSAKAGGFDQAY